MYNIDMEKDAINRYTTTVDYFLVAYLIVLFFACNFLAILFLYNVI